LRVEFVLLMGSFEKFIGCTHFAG